MVELSLVSKTLHFLIVRGRLKGRIKGALPFLPYKTLHISSAEKYAEQILKKYGQNTSRTKQEYNSRQLRKIKRRRETVMKMRKLLEEEIIWTGKEKRKEEN